MVFRFRLDFGSETSTSFECWQFQTDSMSKFVVVFVVNVRLYVWQFDGCNVLLLVLFDDSLIVMEGFLLVLFDA